MSPNWSEHPFTPAVSPNQSEYPFTPSVSPNCPEHPSTLRCPQTEAELRAGTCRHRPQQGQGPLRCPQSRTGATAPAGTIPSPTPNIPLPSAPARGFAGQKPGGVGVRTPGNPPDSGGYCPEPQLLPIPQQSNTNTTICCSARLPAIKRNSWNNFSHPHIPGRRGRGSDGADATRCRPSGRAIPPRRALLAPIINLEVCRQTPGSRRLFRQESRRR